MKPVHATKADAVKARWFSRRHQTNEENTRAREAYQANHGKEARREAAEIRQAVRNSHTHGEQLHRLDIMFGEGQGAKRERARLIKLIQQQQD